MKQSAETCDEHVSFREAARQTIVKQTDVLFDNLDGTRKGDDPEALHDMRVASRRLRAALSVFGPAYPAKKIAGIESEVSRVTDALGAVRDADVQLEFMDGVIGKATENERIGLEAFAADIRTQRDRDRKALVREMDRLERSRLQKQIKEVFAEPGGGQGDDHG